MRFISESGRTLTVLTAAPEIKLDKEITSSCIGSGRGASSARQWS